MDDQLLYAEIARALEAREPRALATIVEARGSVPRDVGAKLLVAPDGRLWGTVGGGKMESLVIEAALETLRTGVASTREYPLHEGSPASFGAICGGTVVVFVEPLNPGPRMLIVGSGHCAQALARAAATLGWSSEIVEDRAEIVAGGDVPGATRRSVEPDLAAAMTAAPLDRSTAVCLLNRNPGLDRDCLEAVLRRATSEEADSGARRLVAPFYVGMIGSRKKVDTVQRELRDRGLDMATLALVHAPVGVEIYAETPQEIAISILAEVVREWRVRQANSVRLRRSVPAKPESAA